MGAMLEDESDVLQWCTVFRLFLVAQVKYHTALVAHTKRFGLLPSVVNLIGASGQDEGVSVGGMVRPDSERGRIRGSISLGSV